MSGLQQAGHRWMEELHLPKVEAAPANTRPATKWTRRSALFPSTFGRVLTKIALLVTYTNTHSQLVDNSLSPWLQVQELLETRLGWTHYHPPGFRRTSHTFRRWIRVAAVDTLIIPRRRRQRRKWTLPQRRTNARSLAWHVEISR